MRISGVLGVFALTIVACVFAVVMNTCGRSQRNGVIPAGKPADTQDMGGPADTQELSEAMAELDAYPCPEGVDVELWGELKDALGEALQKRVSSVGAIHESPSDEKAGRTSASLSVLSLSKDGDPALQHKFASTPPTGDENRVTDLTVTDAGGGNYILSWHYRNLGDYDQSGVVGISDITPIAMHYGETYTLTDTNCFLAVIDGSTNGVVDIADITPIAMNYATDCTGYAIERSISSSGTFIETVSVPLDCATGEGRKAFSYGVLLAAGQWVRVSPCDGEGIQGIAGNPVEVPEAANQPPVAQLVADPVEGDAPLTVDFDAGGSYDPDGSIATYDYDWDGDGSYELIDGGTAPTHVYESVGDYDATVQVTDDRGATDTALVGISATENAAPVADILAAPTSGNTPLLVEFNGSGSTDDGVIVKYEWDWDGEADGWSWYDSGNEPLVDHTYNQEGTYEATLRVTDDEDAVDTDSVTITVTQGDWLVCVVDPTVGEKSLPGGLDNSLAEVDGRPGIAYYHAVDWNLRFAICSSADGTGEWDLQLVDGDMQVGEFCSLAIVGGLPAISYYDSITPYLGVKFVINSEPDASGTWSTHDVDDYGQPGTPTSLAEVAGKPAIAYLDMLYDRIAFARNSAADGSGTWTIGEVYSHWTHELRRCQLAVIAGKPAVVYHHGYDMQLMYAANSAADGSGVWINHTIDDTCSAIGYRLTLAEIAGRPAAVYRLVYHDPQLLRFAICSNADGSGTWTYSTVDSYPQSWDYPSLKVVDGYPAIAYCAQDGRVLYAVNSMPDGSGDWGIATVAQGVGYVSWTYLAVIDGSPGISFHDSGDDTLKYAYKVN